MNNNVSLQNQVDIYFTSKCNISRLTPLHHHHNKKVNVFDKGDYWIARVKMVFKTGGERAGWSRKTISKNLRCCKRLKILVRLSCLSAQFCTADDTKNTCPQANEIKKDFQKSTVLLFRVRFVRMTCCNSFCLCVALFKC